MMNLLNAYTSVRCRQELLHNKTVTAQQCRVRFFVKLVACWLLVCTGSCHTRLNDEQRRQLNEARRQIEIRQVPEADLLSGGFLLGKRLAQALPDSFSGPAVGRLSAEHQVGIRWFDGANPSEEPELAALMQAYAYSLSQGQQPEGHVKRSGKDSVLYVHPVIQVSDTAKKLAGMWRISIPVKKIVLEAPKP
ncbi:MAG: hypothetical protein KatS3mg032_1330 [Cyclobacteriaceae bacterium]|nr:MAG: hypothetical protein KatS3mg032_1330 [Cyclobacteriaceae bacterium]